MTTQTQHGIRKTAVLLCTCATLAACTSGGGGNPLDNLDWDLRGGPAMTTADAARGVTAARPAPDSRGVISYPGYQVAVARRGDTAATVAARIGLSPQELASYNAIDANATLRDGEVLALPRRVEGGGFTPGTAISGGTVASAPIAAPGMARPGTVDVSSIATTALDRVGSAPAPATVAPATAPAATTPSGEAPTRHQVKRGETAFSIARTYGVSARALADWNGLGPDLDVREGQYLMIPTPTGAPLPDEAPAAPKAVATSAPGAGTPTPTPPSAKKPLPAETPKTAAEIAAEAPPSPDLGTERTASSSAQFVMPVSGNIIRPYAPKKNEGIDIAAPAGTPVKAAAAGTVAAITQDTEQTPIVVIRHEGGLLTVYAGVAGITVKKGDKVSRGQAIATVRSGNPAFLHFEVRQGVNSTDPMPYLQ